MERWRIRFFANISYHFSHSTTNIAPSKLLNNRDIRTKLPSLPTKVTKEFTKATINGKEKKEKASKHFDQKFKIKVSPINKGDYVILPQKKTSNLEVELA